MFYQQGDVIIEKVTGIPNSAVAQDSVGRIVLAAGSATGHAHVINDTTTTKVSMDGSTMYLSVSKDTVVSHEEHNAITIEAGEYIVRKVMEYDHFDEEVKEVQD